LPLLRLPKLLNIALGLTFVALCVVFESAFYYMAIKTPTSLYTRSTARGIKDLVQDTFYAN
jgi:hypothetical protein